MPNYNIKTDLVTEEWGNMNFTKPVVSCKIGERGGEGQRGKVERGEGRGERGEGREGEGRGK